VADGAATGVRGACRRGSRWRRRAMYHGGRLGMYALFGAVAGASGAVIEGRGFGRGLAVAAGLALMTQACVAAGAAGGGIGRAASTRLAGALARAAGWLRRHGLARPSVMGALNGLLPCGLVYAALIGAAGTGSVAAALSLMIGFGLGTLPALLGVGVVSGLAAGRGGPGGRRVAMPVALGVAGVVLIARGLGPAAHHDHVGVATPSPALPASIAASGHAHH